MVKNLNEKTAKLTKLQINWLQKILQGSVSLEDTEKFLGIYGRESSLGDSNVVDFEKFLHLQITLFRHVNYGTIVSISAFENFLNNNGKFKISQYKIFGKPLLEKEISIDKAFSFNERIRDGAEFKYGSVDKCLKDKYLKVNESVVVPNKATLKIVPTIESVDTVSDLIEKLGGQIGLFIIGALHQMLVTDSNSLNEIKNSLYRTIVIPVKMQLSGIDPGDYYPELFWDGKCWQWLFRSDRRILMSGTYVALFDYDYQ